MKNKKNVIPDYQHCPPPPEKPNTNKLKAPANYSLQEIFQELKFGRPAKSQKYLQKCIDELNGIEHYTFLVEFMFKTGENDYSHLRLLEAENEEHAYQKALKWFPENYPQSEYKGCIVYETI